MIANHIHDALAQVRKLKVLIIDKHSFRGYSGTARITGGLAALAGTLVLGCGKVPPTITAHLVGWGVVLGLAMAINYGALTVWFFRDPEARKDPTKGLPAVDAIPALAIGGVLTLALILREQHAFLFGTWMCLFGLAHASYRLTLPKTNYAVGIYYAVCGAACLLLFDLPFTNPWPMGLVFFIGETVGGVVLYRHRLEGDNHDTTN